MTRTAWSAIAVGMTIAPVLRAKDEPAEPPIEVTVQTRRPDAPGRRHLTLDTFPSVASADALAQQPGVWVVRRGAAAPEPVIRGLGGERVVTQVGHLPLYGACPGKMDPPLVYLRPHLASNVWLDVGLPSVTDGSAGTAGRVVVDTEPRWDRARSGQKGEISARYEGARRGFGVGGQVSASVPRLYGSVGGEAQQLGDYHSANGERVPARQTEYGATVQTALAPTPRHYMRQALSYVRHQDVDYPALPMDLDWTNAWIYDMSYRIALDAPALVAARIGFGAEAVDHAMSNRLKPNRGMLRASTESRVRSVAGVGSLAWRLADVAVLETGLDTMRIRREAERTRVLPASGQEFHDLLWPDARQTTTGMFAELRWISSDAATFRLGARLNRVQSTAAAALEPGRTGEVLQDAYSRFYGTGRQDSDVVEVAAAANALVQWDLGSEVSHYAGMGTNTRPAGITERFFAFAPAPGGFQVGNPGLAQETKYTVVWGTAWRRDELELTLDSYAAWVDDFILPTTIAREDVNGDGSEDRVRGFHSVEATLLGGEAGIVPRLTRELSVPTSFAVVYGQNETDGRPLPEIPPWELRTALRADFAMAFPWWAEVGARWDGKQTRVDEAFGEDATPAFIVAHLRAGATILDHFELAGAIENLLDAEYHEHLTREAVFAQGGLTQNGEIPAPGRSAHARVRAWLP